MTKEKKGAEESHVAAQVAAAWAALDAASRDAQLRESLLAQDGAFLKAFREMQAVRTFIGSRHTILGSEATKHGEIAEQVHVGVRRAMDALNGLSPSASFDGVGRFDAVDYKVDGVSIQSKYINGIQRTLDHIKSHAEKYPEFAAGNSRYHIPRDQFEQLEQLTATGEIDGFADRSAQTLQRKLREIELATGRHRSELIEPGEATYSEVQQGKIHETVESREKGIADRNEELKEAARVRHGPSFEGLAKASALGAAAGGGVRIGQACWVKYREGKNPFKGDFSVQDWKDVGVEGGKGAAGGAVAGGALYVLTNSTDLAAPFAGAMVSGLMGMGSLVNQYHAGEINADEFAEMAHFVAVDAAIVGLASAAGQVLIPIPILGAFIGSLAGKVAASTLKASLGKAEQELIDRLARYEAWAYGQLDDEYQAVLTKLDSYFGNLESLAALAFDENVNLALRLQVSIQFAEAVGVPTEKILRTTDDIDAFMME
ncbi:MAG: hypothetical protein H0U74_04790 [Bradymonadaceae bacterium]|nr:hypothetical protein [Lujinxingiaceae bacterium]